MKLAAYTPAPEAPRQPARVPLTHHEMLRWAEPFVRAGRAVDLAASDRAARRLALRTVEHPAAGTLPALREELVLANEAPGEPFTLERRLVAAGAPVAVLVAEGGDAAALLAAVTAVPAARQLRFGQGWCCALAQRVEPLPSPGAVPALRLVQAGGRVAGLQLTMEVSRVKGVAAELRLQPLDGAAAPRALPEDLLAVLGLPWSRLVLRGGVWRASVVLRGGGAARSADAESRLLTTLQHLAAVLAAPPGTFHDRFRAARWRASARRGVPLAVCLGLIGASAAVPRLELGTDSVFRMLIFNAPPLLLLWMVAMRELPRIEIPPLPRRPAPDAWTPATPCLPTP